MPLTDNFGRLIHDLRISITDRCNYKCVYCRTGTNGAVYSELPFEDYLRMAQILVSLGITKIRLTGGEPLLRKGIVEFVRDLAKLRTLEEKKPEIALTTNGHLLAEIAQPLKDAGLDRVTVSMDAVDPKRFARITRVPNGYENVLEGVRASRLAGLDPVKINCVLLRGFNEDQIVNFGKFAREEQVVVRFIEFMPLEEDRVWTPEIVVTLDEILSRMSEYLRDGATLPLCRWRRRNWDHCAGIASLLRTLQSDSDHFGRQAAHMFIFGVGPRPARVDAARRHGRETG
jgi:cyclic pyranopterin phosphate synthase